MRGWRKSRIPSGNWLIWSIEQGRWWKNARQGYTTHRDEAGRYTFAEAIAIVGEANNHISNEEKPPSEAMLPDTYGRDHKDPVD
jgi:hypothetical protein